MARRKHRVAARNESVFFVNPSETIIESIVFIKSNFKTLNTLRNHQIEWLDSYFDKSVKKISDLEKKRKRNWQHWHQALVTANDDASSHRLTLPFDYVNLMWLELNVLLSHVCKTISIEFRLSIRHTTQSHFRIQFFRNWPRLEKQIALKFRHDGAITFGNDNSIGVVIWSTLSKTTNCKCVAVEFFNLP